MRRIRLLTAVVALLPLFACSHDPKVIRQRHFDRAENYFSKKDYKSARIEYLRAVAADPSFAPAFYRLGVTEQELQDWAEAYRAFSRAVQLDAHNADAWRRKGEIELAARRVSDARESAKSSIAADANNEPALLLLGRALLAEKSFAEALQQFEKAAAAAPQSAEPLDGEATAYALAGKLSEAEAKYKEAIAKDPHYYAAYLDLAQLYGAQKQPAKRIATLESAVAANPKVILGYPLLALDYLRGQQAQKIEPLFGELRKATQNSGPALVTIARFYRMTGDSQRAISVLQEEIAKDPGFDEARKRLIEIYLEQNDWNAAEALNAYLLKRNPNDNDARLYQAQLLLGRGNKGEAVSKLEALAHDAPDVAPVQAALGMAYGADGNVERAIASLRNAVKLDPNLTTANVTLSNLELAKGNAKSAAADADAALAHAPWFAPAHIAKANAELALGDNPRAERELLSITGPPAQTPEVQERLGYVMAREKRYADAQRYLERALDIRADFVPAMRDLLEISQVQGRLAEGIARVQKQIERAPQQGDFDELLGAAQLLARNPAGAEKAYLNAIAKNPKAYASYIRLAQIYSSQKRFEEAIEKAQTARQIRPDLTGSYLLLGTLYQETGAIAQARTAYQQALDHDANSVAALNNLAWIDCENGGNLDVALSLAQRAKQNAPDNPNVADTLGWIQYKKGVYGAAAESFQAAVKAVPGSPMYQYHLGLSLWKSGQLGPAQVALQKALQLRLNPADAAQARTALQELNRKPS